MKKIICITLIFVSFPSFADIKVGFTPSAECENAIAYYINNAQKSVDAAVYSINNEQIVTALKNAHNRGIKLRILTDKLQASTKYSKALDLYQYGVNIKVNSKYKVEHNKFAVFDGKLLSTGSFNWTTPASKQNSENCLLISKEPGVINSYQQRFEELWSLNPEFLSDKWFQRKVKK